jgi:hypothetical protein
VGIGDLASAKRPFIVSRSELPISSAEDGCSWRALSGAERLAEVLASTSDRISWIEARPGRRLGPYRDPEPALLIILRGTAELVGATRRIVERGDAITLPANQEYGFSTGETQGVEVLHLSLAADSQREADAQLTLGDVLARNELRLRAWLRTPYLRMFEDGSLDAKNSRRCFKRCIRLFSDLFQTFLFTRQATCREQKHHRCFNAHLSEEFGHNKLLEDSDDPGVCSDPSLQATLSWFCHQMLVLDNAGKVAINLVLESAGYHFHNVAKPVFQGDRSERYFGTHAEDDQEHQEMGLELLRGQPPATYRVLVGLIDQGWDMLEATTERIYELVCLEQAAS